MRYLVMLGAICTLSETALAETPDCKTIPDPALRLTCYDKINPPVATYPIPLPKPSRPIPTTRPDGTVGDSLNDDDASMRAQMRNVCRGC